MLTKLEDATPAEVLANRENVTYTTRRDKLYLNTLALHGGRPYINARLTRFPGESAIDWNGTQADVSKTKFGDTTSSKIEGRKYRAYLVNHAARIAEKIRQYVFAKPPDRKGLNAELTADITRQGESINSFMGEVLKNIVATKWCWIGIDSPEINGQLSQADASANKVRPYWHLYSAGEVKDWAYDDKGDLLWLITETCKHVNTDPNVFNPVQTVRRLWEIGSVTEYVIAVSPTGLNKIESETVKKFDLEKVPFVLAGELSDNPHWYDDVEDLLRACLDLESSLDTLMHKVVFGQMVLPESITEDATSQNGGSGISPTIEAVVGLSNAVTESPEDKGITRYIGPDATAIKAMQDELARKREELFDVVGLHLNFTKNFSESADSKSFDHLDPQAVLRNYAQQIREAEIKAWKLTAEWDKAVKEVEPNYSDKFRVSNIYEDMKALVLSANMDVPDSVKKLVNHGIVDTVLEITDRQLTDEQQAEIDKDIDEMEFDEPIVLNPAEMGGKTVSGVADQATSDGDLGESINANE